RSSFCVPFFMKQLILKHLFPILALATALPVWSQGCDTRDEIPAQARASMESAAQQVFDQASRGDVNALRAASAPSLQSGFADVAGAIADNKAAFTGAHPQLRTTFLLDTGPAPSADGNFVCGVFGAGGGTANSAEFYIPGLPAGKYAIVIQDF